MTIDTKHFEKKLLEEKALLEKDLSGVAEHNPDHPTDWEAKAGEHDSSAFEENMEGDSIDQYQTNNAVVNSLEPRLHDINDALMRIEGDTFGICKVCGNEIESDRLEANPAADTCTEHMM
jgi:RNA polymerase-binding transcription factor DksA